MAIGTTIDGLNVVTALTAQDEVPLWDAEASGEPTKKITAQNMAASVKSLASLPNTTEMNAAIAQSTASITQKIESNTFVNNVDANNYTTFGFYHVGVSANSPVAGYTLYGMLLVFTGGTGFVAQLFVTTNNVIYFRYRNNSSSAWLRWQKITSTAA